MSVCYIYMERFWKDTQNTDDHGCPLGRDTRWMGTQEGRNCTSHYILFWTNTVLQTRVTYWRLNKQNGWLIISPTSFSISSLLFSVPFPSIHSTSRSLHRRLPLDRQAVKQRPETEPRTVPKTRRQARPGSLSRSHPSSRQPNRLRNSSAMQKPTNLTPQRLCLLIFWKHTGQMS